MKNAKKAAPSATHGPQAMAEESSFSGWTFLTNHTHVLVCLARERSLTVRKLALRIGITERSVQRILAELEGGGVLRREKHGRQNVYEINGDFQLRHPLESHQTVGKLMKLLK